MAPPVFPKKRGAAGAKLPGKDQKKKKDDGKSELQFRSFGNTARPRTDLSTVCGKLAGGDIGYDEFYVEAFVMTQPYCWLNSSRRQRTIAELKDGSKLESDPMLDLSIDIAANNRDDSSAATYLVGKLKFGHKYGLDRFGGWLPDSGKPELQFTKHTEPLQLASNAAERETFFTFQLHSAQELLDAKPCLMADPAKKEYNFSGKATVYDPKRSPHVLQVTTGLHPDGSPMVIDVLVFGERLEATFITEDCAITLLRVHKIRTESGQVQWHCGLRGVVALPGHSLDLITLVPPVTRAPPGNEEPGDNFVDLADTLDPIDPKEQKLRDAIAAVAAIGHCTDQLETDLRDLIATREQRAEAKERVLKLEDAIAALSALGGELDQRQGLEAELDALKERWEL